MQLHTMLNILIKILFEISTIKAPTIGTTRKALCDGPQSLKPEKFDQVMKKVKGIAEVVEKEI